MGARFRIRKHDGAELTPGSLEAFTRLVSSGEIEELDLIYDALTGEWAPARAHPVYRTVVEGLHVEEDLGLSVVPPEPEPSPEDAARAFVAEMEEERRADPDRPAQPLDFPLVDRGAGDLSRNERPTPPMLAPKTAEPNLLRRRPKPRLRAGPIMLMVLGSLLLVATLIASLRTGPSSLEARAPGVGMSVNAGRALPALERATRRRAVECRRVRGRSGRLVWVRCIRSGAADEGESPACGRIPGGTRRRGSRRRFTISPSRTRALRLRGGQGSPGRGVRSDRGTLFGCALAARAAGAAHRVDPIRAGQGTSPIRRPGPGSRGYRSGEPAPARACARPRPQGADPGRTRRDRDEEDSGLGDGVDRPGP